MKIEDFTKRLKIHKSNVVHAAIVCDDLSKTAITACGSAYSTIEHNQIFIRRRTVPPTVLSELYTVTCKHCLAKLNLKAATKTEKTVKYVLMDKQSGYYYKKGPIGKNCCCVASVFDSFWYNTERIAILAGTVALYEHKSDKSILAYKNYVLLSNVAKKEYKYVYKFNSDLFEVKKIILSVVVKKVS